MSASISKHDNLAIIGRWKISKLIRKGHNTWIHEGIDIENNKIVALKFISKADKSWVKQQVKQIETEIEALKKIRHKHVTKLYAYNLNAKYPINYKPNKHKNGKKQHHNKKHSIKTKENIDNNKNNNKNNNKQEYKQEYITTVLLVLEYASCGELFNLLYYTSGLTEIIARTYFKQIIYAIQSCHNNGIIHRDLRPKNILLNDNYSIKITNFATSKIIKSDSDYRMKTKYFGARSYQSPQILMNNDNDNNKIIYYDFKCDIFSIGVILFILLAGYPPFEEATENDKWYKKILEKNYDRFWEYHHHQTSAAGIPLPARDLLNKMLAFECKERIDINEIKKHEWFSGVILGRYTLQAAIQQRYRDSEQKRRTDIRCSNKTGQVNESNPLKPIPLGGIIDNVPSYTEPYKLILYPINKIECMTGDVYTFGWDNTRPIYDFISSIISSQGQGSTKYNKHENKLYCKLMVKEHLVEIKFNIRIYLSRIWYNKYLESYDENIGKDKNIYIVTFERLYGDEFLFHKMKKEFLLRKCASIFKGLPKWARQMMIDEKNGVVLFNNYQLELLFNGYIKRFMNINCEKLQKNEGLIPYDVRNVLFDFYMEEIIDNSYDESLLDFKW